MMLRLSRAVVLVAVFLAGSAVLAESVPSLDELRSTIKEQAATISQGKQVGFAYTAWRSLSAAVPSENLPKRFANQQADSGNSSEIFARKDGLRALARNSWDVDAHSFETSVTTWNGKVLSSYYPLLREAHLRPKDDDVSQIDELFSRWQGPFAWAFLPNDVASGGTCSQPPIFPRVELSQVLAYEGLHVLDEIDILDDSKCVVIANDAGPFLWLDKDRGFVVKQFIQPVTHLPGVERLHYFNESFVQVAANLWAVERGFMLLRGPGIDYEHVTHQNYLGQIHVSFKDIHFNEAIEDSIFDLELPPGTSVMTFEEQNGRSNRSYVKGFLP